MKFIALVASLASVAVAAEMSTVTCPECKTPTSTNDMVTRSPIPTTSCDAPSLTVVKTGNAQSTGGMGSMSGSATGGQSGNPTGVPVTGGAGRIAGGALAAAVVAVAML